MRMTFDVTPHQRLVFTEEAVTQMQAYRQTQWWQTEAGGVLLGRHLLETEDIVVDEVTAPQKEDRRGRFSFFRSRQHNALARGRWDASQSTEAYLGLWHTHPEKDPCPSGVDRLDWEQALKLDTFDGNRLFFPIVGIERIRVWTKRRSGPIEELHEVRRKGER